MSTTAAHPRTRRLADLRNVGKAALADFAVLGITSIEDLVPADPPTLYTRLCAATGARHDPCVEDVFAAAIHEARTGEAKDWWAFTPARKARQQAATGLSHIPAEGAARQAHR